MAELPILGVTKSALEDQFLAHLREVYLTMTGQPFGERAKQAMLVLAQIVATTGEGTYRTESPDHGARAMIGMLHIVVKTFDPQNDED